MNAAHKRMLALMLCAIIYQSWKCDDTGSVFGSHTTNCNDGTEVAGIQRIDAKLMLLGSTFPHLSPHLPGQSPPFNIGPAVASSPVCLVPRVLLRKRASECGSLSNNTIQTGCTSQQATCVYYMSASWRREGQSCTRRHCPPSVHPAEKAFP